MILIHILLGIFALSIVFALHGFFSGRNRLINPVDDAFIKEILSKYKYRKRRYKLRRTSVIPLALFVCIVSYALLNTLVYKLLYGLLGNPSGVTTSGLFFVLEFMCNYFSGYFAVRIGYAFGRIHEPFADLQILDWMQSGFVTLAIISVIFLLFSKDISGVVFVTGFIVGVGISTNKCARPIYAYLETIVENVRELYPDIYTEMLTKLSKRYR